MKGRVEQWMKIGLEVEQWMKEGIVKDRRKKGTVTLERHIGDVPAELVGSWLSSFAFC